MPISRWVHKLIDRVNGPDGEDGAETLVDAWPTILRICRLMRLRREDFDNELMGLIALHEAQVERQMRVQAVLSKHSYPSLTDKNWHCEIHAWMQTVLTAFLGFEIEVPEPPVLNRAQRRAFKKYGFMVLFVPAISEAQYPDHVIKPAWGQYLREGQIERVELPGRWIAIETIEKPNYQDRVYPDDKLMADIGIKTRFAHPHSGKGEGDDILEDLLPKIGVQLALKQGQSIDLPSAEIWNFVGNLFDWLTEHTQDTLPELGSTASWEWVKNSYVSRYCLFVGSRVYGGLANVNAPWRGDRHGGVGFRALVIL